MIGNIEKLISTLAEKVTLALKKPDFIVSLTYTTMEKDHMRKNSTKQ